MIYIESLVKELLPELCNGNSLSIACLCTSNPVYLVFINNEPYPGFVVRISASEEMRKTHLLSEKIYEIAGDLIPQPLSLSRNDAQYISIQAGLKGDPWFQVAGKYSTPEQWLQFKNKTIDSLTKLHQAVASNPDWNRTCEPGNELRHCYQQCIESGTILPPGVEKQVELFSTQLDNLGKINSFAQHGDFCINNLIIEPDTMHIIDFEDFGMTYMPLHDEFTLALSTYQLAPKTVQASITEDIDLCITHSLEQLNIDRSYIPGFFMHHLLLRLGAWSQNRLPYRQWLLSILEKFINDAHLIAK